MIGDAPRYKEERKAGVGDRKLSLLDKRVEPSLNNPEGREFAVGVSQSIRTGNAGDLSTKSSTAPWIRSRVERRLSFLSSIAT